MKKKGLLHIGKTWVEDSQSSIWGESKRLCANIDFFNPNTGIDERKMCYFEFEKRYGKYICSERSDAFVLGLLTTAMENAMDVEWEVPISERLFYQLSNYYIPIFAKCNPDTLYNTKLFGPYTSQRVDSKGGVSTGCSGGVDSFYTIVKHNLKGDMTEEHKISHIIYASHGTLDYKRNRVEKKYAEYTQTIKDIASCIGTDYIFCYTNLHEFYKYPYAGFTHLYATIHGAVPVALQKLISIHYESSGAYVTEFTFDLKTVAGGFGDSVDTFTLSNMCTETVTFYSSGSIVTRTDKERFIADEDVVHKYLTVCTEGPAGMKHGDFLNCGQCPKCLRTMSSYYIMGKLDDFQEVFDVKRFYKHKNRYLGKMLGTNPPNYSNYVKRLAKNYHFRFGLVSHLWEYVVYKPLTFARKAFSSNKLAQKFYYGLNLDTKLRGYKSPSHELYEKGKLRV